MNKFSKTQQMLFSLIGDPKINKKLKKNLIESLDTKNIDLICEFVLNVFNKNMVTEKTCLFGIVRKHVSVHKKHI
jgi:hypothetical protein